MKEAESNQKIRVLIVDDSLLVRERLSCRLGKINGVDIAGKASDGPGAVDAFRKLLPDVVILDLQMPGGSGIDVLATIKRDRPGTQVIILTNYPLAQFREICRDCGAEYFFDKTCEFGKVSDVLKELAQRRSGATTSESQGI